MNETRKRQLRQRYLKARSIVHRACEDAGCGEAVLRFISPSVDAACREMDAIEAEVRQAMKEAST